MPDMFDDLAVPAELTAQCYILHPGKKTRIKNANGEEAYIEVYGWHSAAAQRFRFEREERMRRLARELSAEESYDDLGDLIAQLTVSWKLITPTGRMLDVECNYENARKLFNGLDHRWLRQQVIDFLNNEANFIPPSWKT